MPRRQALPGAVVLPHHEVRVDELLEALDGLEWPEMPAKTMQRNWIGRSEGVEFDLPVEGRYDLSVRVFTTRPDTSFGMTYAVMAPQHPLVDELTTEDQLVAVDALRARAAAATDIERMTESDTAGLGKRGAFTGVYVINPFTGNPVPLYVADYVLTGYGTGAIMAVPAEDERDRAFATQHQLPIVRTVQPPEDWDANGGQAYTGDGTKINSGFLDGLDIDAAKARAIEWLEDNGVGERKVNYRLRDWLGVAPALLGLPDPRRRSPRSRRGAGARADQLPIACPIYVEFLPTGQSPLAFHEGFLRHLPDCGGPARRETDTMDTFVDSSWYFLRFCDPWNTEQPFAPLAAQHFMPVDQYIGGIEHAILHLLYARFYTRALDRRRVGARCRPRALQALPRPGHDPHGRDQDVQVQGQPHRARALLRHGGRGRAAPVPPLRGPALRRHGLVRADRAGH